MAKLAIFHEKINLQVIEDRLVRLQYASLGRDIKRKENLRINVKKNA